jgi:hypothetical protein
MTHKEFYIWLEGYLYGKLENVNINILPIIEKMNEVKEDQSESVRIMPFERIPVPINPLPRTNDPISPPWEVTCNTKTQLND